MNFKKLSLIFVAGLLGATSLIGCGSNNGGGNDQPGGGEQEVVKYSIQFLNDDSTVLKSEQVAEGQMPVAPANPTKAATAEYSYAFAGWDKEIVAATADATYTATYTSTKRSYTIQFLDDDGTELKSQTLEYGETPVAPANPSKDPTAEFTYAFDGWDKDIVPVTGEETYTATYIPTRNSYTITFMNGEDELQSSPVEYGQAPSYDGTPEKESTVQYDYIFAGWSSTPDGSPMASLPAVTGAATYYAQFTAQTRSYEVQFDTLDGSSVPSQSVEYGATVTVPDDPTKDPDEDYFYFFDGWQLNGEPFDFTTTIEGPITLTAKWDAVSKTEHAHRCSYVHYEQKDPTYVEPGYKEFWYCELHESFVMGEPTEGSIREATELFTDAIASDDARYIAVLEGGDYFARIDVGPSNAPGNALPAFRTANAYDNIVGYTLKYRISGGFAPGKSSWAGFYVGSETDDVYSVYESSCGGKDINLYNFDGQWHELTVRFDGSFSGYFAFGHALTNFAEGTYVDIDNLVIYADETISEEFALAPSILLIESEFVKVGGEAKAALPEAYNNFMRIHLTNNIDHTFAYSFKAYSNITKITFKYRLNKEGGFRDGASSAWFGVKTGASSQDPDSYNEKNLYIWKTSTINTSNSGNYFSGAWQDFSTGDVETEGYVGFCTCADYKPGSFLDIDNVTIYTTGGTFNETFDTIAPLFGASSKKEYQQYLSFEVEELVSTDKAFDPEKGQLMIYNYSAKNTLVTENVNDPTYGSCVKITTWHGYDNMWLGFPSTASHEELVRGLDGEEPTEFYFHVYNSGASDVTMKLRYGKDDWTDRATVTFTAGEWTEFVYPINSNIPDISKLSFNKWAPDDPDAQTTICDENTQLTFTAIYVRHTGASLNPAPFGVVAWDAQSGGVRDIKGRNNTATVSHGVDADYGAYIQLDDWTCGPGGKLCWLTLSDSAKAVSAIETELGSGITNYFFYIYNPTADAFSFRIMAQSSSALNPNINVSCAPGAWTKVTIDYNHADNGSYPAITSASQIGIDHECANDGDSIGSGWKITSVYAE